MSILLSNLNTEVYICLFQNLTTQVSENSTKETLESVKVTINNFFFLNSKNTHKIKNSLAGQLCYAI